MLTKIIFTLNIMVLCHAQHQIKKDERVSILQYDNEGVNHDGSYKFSYKTGNGIQAEESGYVKQLDGHSEEESKAQVVQGTYSYTGPDGVVYTVNYIADENGFRAVGAHLPNNFPSSATGRPINYDEEPITLPSFTTTLRPTTTQPPATIPPAVGFPPVRVG